ncbi:MAG: FtsQ-type POTRA domain-containing protein [Deltaproteobacteria bacterium]|nr:FtsQ-type POTRA domain-containing protein [Deltaproteobacteria bacterium]
MKNKLFVRSLLGFLFLLVSCFIAEEVYQKLCRSDFFQITSMKIDGNKMVSNKQISVLSNIDIHSNLLAINIHQVQSLLKSHPWIAGAEVTRSWPNQLLINIKEKKPVALLNRESGLFYLDNRGRIIASAGPDQELDFPVVTGLENIPMHANQAAEIPAVLVDVMQLLQLASGKNSILPEQNISEIPINPDNGLLLYLLEKPFPIHMGTDGDISKGYYRLVKVLRDLYKTKEFSKVSYIRMDYQEDTVLVGKTESDMTHRG